MTSFMIITVLLKIRASIPYESLDLKPRKPYFRGPEQIDCETIRPFSIRAETTDPSSARKFSNAPVKSGGTDGKRRIFPPQLCNSVSLARNR